MLDKCLDVVLWWIRGWFREHLGLVVLHCWMPGPFDESSSTCMKRYNHSGKHRFTPDSKIAVRIQ